MNEPAAKLAQLLGDHNALTALTPAEAELLYELIQRKREAQHAETMSAIDDALQVLPRLIRIPAKKILFG